MFYIRSHHLLSITLPLNKTYDEWMSDNFNIKIYGIYFHERLYHLSHYIGKIKIIKGCDSICFPCRYRRICNNKNWKLLKKITKLKGNIDDFNIDLRDDLFLKKYNIQIGDIIHFKDLVKYKNNTNR